MTTNRWAISASAVAIAAVLAADPVLAQQTTGTPGSPEATTTIPGDVLPPFPQKFGGTIQLNAAQSKPWWPPRVVPPTAGGADGNIVSEGGRFGGYGLYLLKNKPVFAWNLLDLRRVKWEGPELARLQV